MLPFKAMSTSTIGTFLRTFTFGHVRQLDAVCSQASRRVGRWCRPGSSPVVIDLDSTICEVHGKQTGTGYGYTGVLGITRSWPPCRTGEVVAPMRLGQRTPPACGPVR